MTDRSGPEVGLEIEGGVGEDPHPGRIRLDPARCIAARKRRGLSRAALVEAAEPGFPISEATVKRAEKGRAINLEKAATLARLLHVPLEALLPESPATPSPVTLGPPPPHPGDPPGIHRSSRSAPLVGRSDELERLRCAWRQARDGRPALVLLRGEAGVGKSRLLREIGREIACEGGVFCPGRGHEHTGSPFGPFVEALLARPELLESAPPADRPLLERVLGATPDAARTDSEEAGEGLFPALSRVWLAPDPPRALAIDDLQWADRASIDLVEHLARSALQAAESGARCPLLLIASLRTPTGDGAAGPRDARLDAFARIASTIDVGGLDAAETHELVAAAGVARPSVQLVSTLFEATAGNPLFLQETLRLLQMRGALKESGGFAVTDVPARDLELPETLIGVISARASGLSTEARRCLVRGAFLGHRFDLPRLAAVMDEPEEDVLEALEEAVADGFLINRDQDFEFAHPLSRQVFHQEPIAARAQRIHREIAERLERWYGARADEHAREIAGHLVQAGPVAAVERTLRFARIAAGQASHGFAWEEEARFLQAIVEIGRARGELSDRELAELERRAGVALHRCWDVGPALSHYEAAAAAFERAGDRLGLARTLNDAVRIADNLGLRGPAVERDTGRLEALAAELGPEHAHLRGQILDTLATVHWGAGRTRRADELAREALAIGESAADDDLCAQVSTALALSHLRQLDLGAACERWRAGTRFARRAGDELREVRCLQRLPIPLLLSGELEQAEEISEDAWRRSVVLRNAGEASIPRSAQAAIALLRGEFARADRLGEETLSILRTRRYAWAGPLLLPTLLWSRALRGRVDEALALLGRLMEPGEIFEDPRRFAAAARRYEWWLRSRHASGDDWLALRDEVDGRTRRPLPDDRLDLAMLDRLCVEVELGHALDLPRLLERARPLLGEAAARGTRVIPGGIALVPRLLGLAAAAAGDVDESERWFEETLALADAMESGPERARVWLEWSQLESRRPGGTAARVEELARRGRTEAGKLGMVVTPECFDAPGG